MPDRRTLEALRRVREQKTNLQHHLELFYMFVFGVFFGVLSSLMAIFWDAMVRGIRDYPAWYVITICVAFTATLVGLFFLFNRFKQQRKDLQLMEENFEEMLHHR